jgi:hypothetical protein
MGQIIARIIAWLAGKILIYALILGVLLAIFVIKVVPPMVVRYHEKELEKAIAELSESKALVGELAERAKGVGSEIDGKIKELRELEEKRQTMEKWLEKVMNIFRRGEVEAEKKAIEAQEKKVREEMAGLSAERQRIMVEGGETEEEIKRRELLRDEKEKQLREIQNMRRALDELMTNQLRELALKALLILAALIIVPFLWKLAAYYVIAPYAESSEPILLGAETPGGGGVTATPSHPAQRIQLGENEVLMAKVDYLQGSMGGFEKRTKWLMDWRYPFSSMAAGLFMLTRIHNTGSTGGQVTLSTSEDATEELAVLDIPEGKSMVFRPHYLVAVSHPLGHPPRIRSRWVFGKLHAWVNLRFRYLIIEGPAKLVFSAQRGVQVEEVLPEWPGRRVNSHLTAAFSPHLSHSPKRAETFIAYLRGKNALFDDFFQGHGHVIQQQVTGGKRNPVARIWEGIFGAIGKVFGI